MPQENINQKKDTPPAVDPTTPTAKNIAPVESGKPQSTGKKKANAIALKGGIRFTDTNPLLRKFRYLHEDIDLAIEPNVRYGYGHIEVKVKENTELAAENLTVKAGESLFFSVEDPKLVTLSVR